MSNPGLADWTAPTRADLDAEEAAETMVAEHLMGAEYVCTILRRALTEIDGLERFPLGFPVAGYDCDDICEMLRDWLALIALPNDAAAVLALSAHAHDVVRTS